MIRYPNTITIMFSLIKIIIYEFEIMIYKPSATEFHIVILCNLIKASKAETNSRNASQKPQRTFLRKGQGLARFKGKSASNKTGVQNRVSAGQSATVQQRKEKKTGNAVGNSSQGNDKQIVTSGGPVAQNRVS